jgi:signal transduction histidine kinase
MPPPPPPGVPPRPTDLAHELTSSLSALLLGLQRLRPLQGGPDKERALVLLDRMETAVRGISALLESLREPPPPAGGS